MTVFLKGWNAGVVLYAKSWKLSYFNRVKYEMLKILHKELLTEFKKKAIEVCETLNVISDHVIQEGDMSQLRDLDQSRENTEILLCNIDNDRIQLNSTEFNEIQ